MTVLELINALSIYDTSKEVLFMRERNNDDITYADEIHKVQQRTLIRNDFESSEFTAVILLHKIPNKEKLK